MSGERIELPPSGLAEDILGQFVAQRQVEADRQAVAEDHQGNFVYHLVTFQLEREEYGVEIASVQEIIRATDITPVPGAAGHVRGVINLRGKIIPVVDLRRRFGLGETADSEASRIVVVELGEKRVGMLVDSVSQVIKVESAAVEDMPEEARGVEGDYILGVAKLEGRLVIILDLKSAILGA
jgi:purine-binding chemotaxis protein CheW